MKKSTAPKTSVFFLPLFVSLFLCLSSGLLTKAQLVEKEVVNTVSCKATVNSKTYDLKPNAGGYFQRITGVKPREVVPIELFYPNGKSGESVVLAVLDGGSINQGKFVTVVPLDGDKKCLFSLHVTGNLGLFRVLVTKGGDQKIVQVWVDPAPEGAQRENRIDCVCGNGNDGGGDCNCSSSGPMSPVGANPFNPYNGNVTRAIRDLEVWGGVGEIPLVAMRYLNSRNYPRIWQVAFHYLLFDGGLNEKGQAQLSLHYPETDLAHIFTQSTTKPNEWIGPARAGGRIFQYGNNFFLQLANGHRYRFERIVISGTTYFNLRDFKDQYQNKYTVTYDNATLKRRFTEPAGRYLEYIFSPRTQLNDPLSVVSSDGRSVQYHFQTLNDGKIDHVQLRSANYGDGTQALYTYSQEDTGRPFAVEHAIDPRIQQVATNMKYTWAIGAGIAGLIHEELNGVTSKVMATLEGTGDERKVLYPNGRLQVLDMPESNRGVATKYTDGVGAETKSTYANGGLGFVKTEADALGRVTTYDSLSIYGNPLEITYPDGSKEFWTRDTLDLVLTHTDKLKRVTTYTRDSSHRPTRIDYPDGSFEVFTYNTFSQVLNHQRKNGCTEHFAYDSRGLKTSFTDCDGKVTLYAYDGADRLAMVTDARGSITKSEYNERGLLTKMINADNSFQTYTYDVFGNRISKTDELGHTWTTTYDEFKRPVVLKDPLNRTTTYSFDLPGGVCGCSNTNNTPTKITLPSGKMTAVAYDVEWRKISETVGAGSADAATTLYEYDLVGNLVKTIDGRGKPWRISYDVRNRRKTATDPLGNTTGWCGLKGLSRLQGV